MSEPRSLYYFPWDPAEYRARTDHLSALARAAFVDLRSSAWMAEKQREAPACSLPDDDVQLARLSRLEAREWKKVAREVRALFTPASRVDTREPVLLDTPLLTTWEEAHQAYRRRATAGSTGGRATSEARKNGQHSGGSASSNATGNAGSESSSKPPAERQQLKLKEVLPLGSDEPRGEAPSAPDGGLAPTGAAPPATGAENGDSLGTSRRAEVVDLLNDLGLPGSTWVDPATPPLSPAELRERRHLLEQAYDAQLGERADRWIATHPEHAAEWERQARAALAFPAGGELRPMQRAAVRAEVLEAYRRMPRSNPIPPRAEWVAQREAGGAPIGAGGDDS